MRKDYYRGKKKKLGLLLAMLHEPKLLVLDEPANGLDVEFTCLSRTRKKLAECVENLEKSIPH